jgi:Ca2+-binding EF-hand superfamily protein
MIFKFNPFYTKADMTVRDIITNVQRGFKAKVKPGYGPWFPASEPYDENTRDLIGTMLTKKVSNRPAAEEILEHPWFSSLRLENALSPAVLKSILSFGIMNPLQKLILATMLRSGILTKEEILATKDTFDLIDIDGDGNVTIEEFASAIKKLQGTDANVDEIERLFDAIDIDQSRTLSLKEFLVARAHRKVCLRPDRLKKIFALYDPDSDMSISPDEMKTVLDANGIILERKQIVMFMKTVDADGDGELSWQEFVAMFHADADKF